MQHVQQIGNHFNGCFNRAWPEQTTRQSLSTTPSIEHGPNKRQGSPCLRHLQSSKARTADKAVPVYDTFNPAWPGQPTRKSLSTTPSIQHGSDKPYGSPRLWHLVKLKGGKKRRGGANNKYLAPNSSSKSQPQGNRHSSAFLFS